MERRFDRRLMAWRPFPTRLSVYLFGSLANLGEVYGGPVGGFADWRHWLIALHAGVAWDDTIPHELAHIFAGWWNPCPPKILAEGFAVWSQCKTPEQLTDLSVRARYPSSRKAMAVLFGPEPAMGDPERTWWYMLAGSFTGFLLRREGWNRYRAFYRDRRVEIKTFPEQFERHYGLHLETAGRVWFGQLPGCSLIDPPGRERL